MQFVHRVNFFGDFINFGDIIFEKKRFSLLILL